MFEVHTVLNTHAREDTSNSSGCLSSEFLFTHVHTLMYFYHVAEGEWDGRPGLYKKVSVKLQESWGRSIIGRVLEADDIVRVCVKKMLTQDQSDNFWMYLLMVR